MKILHKKKMEFLDLYISPCLSNIVKKYFSSNHSKIEIYEQYKSYVKEENYLILKTLDPSEVNCGLINACSSASLGLILVKRFGRSSPSKLRTTIS